MIWKNETFFRGLLLGLVMTSLSGAAYKQPVAADNTERIIRKCARLSARYKAPIQSLSRTIKNERYVKFEFQIPRNFLARIDDLGDPYPNLSMQILSKEEDAYLNCIIPYKLESDDWFLYPVTIKLIKKSDIPSSKVENSVSPQGYEMLSFSEGGMGGNYVTRIIKHPNRPFAISITKVDPDSGADKIDTRIFEKITSTLKF